MRLGSLSEKKEIRHRPQWVIPEVGAAGQLRLERARVLIVGLGGSGSVSSVYLAAAGVGHLRIVDDDPIAMQNLVRQVPHHAPDSNNAKAGSAEEKLHRLHPTCHIEAVRTLFREENGLELAGGCDIILGATDSPAARYELNRVSLARRIPLIYGAINGWNGTAVTFVPGQTCCFTCLFPSMDQARPATRIPALGTVAAFIASVQSMEAVRILSGSRPALANRLLEFRGNALGFRIVPVGKDPGCRECGRTNVG